jgi:hypothetical protein
VKKVALLFIVLGLLILANVGVGFAAVSGATPPKGGLPMLLTNAGQGPGGKMARLLINTSKALDPADFDYNAEPWEKDLQARPYKTLIVVIGSTAKGLGASGITIDQEIARLNRMIAEAKRLKMQIVAVLLEGKIRRGQPGSADERSIDAIAPYADYIVVKKDGNADGKFTAIANKNKVPLTFIDAEIDFPQVIKEMYAK